MSTTINNVLNTIISKVDTGKEGNNNGKIDTEKEQQLFDTQCKTQMDEYSHQIKQAETLRYGHEEQDKETVLKYRDRGRSIGGLIGTTGTCLLMASGPAGWATIAAVSLLAGAVTMVVGDLIGGAIGKVSADSVDNLQATINQIEQERKDFLNAYQEYRKW